MNLWPTSCYYIYEPLAQWPSSSKPVFLCGSLLCCSSSDSDSEAHLLECLILYYVLGHCFGCSLPPETQLNSHYHYNCTKSSLVTGPASPPRRPTRLCIESAAARPPRLPAATATSGAARVAGASGRLTTGDLPVV